MNYTTPPLKSNLPLSPDGRYVLWPQPWGNWLSNSWILLNDVQNTGTTAQRPTTNLYAGKFYFDQSLGANGKPIWMNKGLTGWVLADGTAA